MTLFKIIITNNNDNNNDNNNTTNNNNDNDFVIELIKNAKIICYYLPCHGNE